MGKAPLAWGGAAQTGARRGALNQLWEARMYRSVTESDDGGGGRKRAVLWIEGIGIGALVAVILAYTFL